MQNKNTPPEGKNSAQLEAESALRDAACSALSSSDARWIEGYAAALQDMLVALTGSNLCGKSYDPMTVSEDGKVLNSYAFDMRDGGRHHPVSDYKDMLDIREVLISEVATLLREELCLSNAKRTCADD